MGNFPNAVTNYQELNGNDPSMLMLALFVLPGTHAPAQSVLDWIELVQWHFVTVPDLFARVLEAVLDAS